MKPETPDREWQRMEDELRRAYDAAYERCTHCTESELPRCKAELEHARHAFFQH